MKNPALEKVLGIAMAAHQQGNLLDAARIYAEVLDIEPEHSAALKAYGTLLCQAGEYRAGIDYLERSVATEPNDAEAWSNLANAKRILEEHDGAIAAAETAIRLNPHDAVAHSNLSAALRQANRIGESIGAARRAMDLAPHLPDAAINLASGHQAAGEIAEALDILSLASARLPGHTGIRDNYLFTSLYSDEMTDEDLRELHKGMAPEVSPARPSGPLRRIGFVSGDFRAHPVGQFLLPILRGLAPLEVFLYANQPYHDGVTDELIRAATSFRVIYGESAHAVCQAVAADGIDILIDLSGHSALNRLDVFELRSAPVQATFLGYSGTTGCANVDWLIANDSLVPPSAEHLYTERIARLDRPLFTAPASPRQLPEPGACVTLGSFNNPAKISPPCIRAWGEILRRSPQARLVLKYKFFESEYVAERMQVQFSEQGVASQVDFLGHVSRAEHEALISGLDLALDSFPYTGATTSIECLARGVPVLTLTGDRYVTRMTASLLTELDLAELICSDLSCYVDTAVRLIEDAEERLRLSAEVTKRYPHSRLTDGDGLAEAFADVLQSIWTS